ncbi:3'-5' exonuclease [Terracoccus sp. 273MFTsu3.1]|uniref:3'-5' exonuclease n=1 Tax=Terracoccus sp. 273MFTsu3.1 TaxID=1172188 RepID=UPI000378023A|nr:3'-5' exonuclease [Terracoccus sp. 273MFTsu3.1]
MLHLPDFSALSEEQDDVLDLPLDSSVIVTGPPGTGKTIIAIWRANMLHRSERPTLLLMYGKLLSSYTQAAVKTSGTDGVVSTYHRWFPQFFKEAYGVSPPKVDRYNFDWGECKKVIMTSPVPPAERRHIIVDEGQDLPQDFFLVLRLVSRSMTILADENQRITSDQSTIAEIKAATGIREVRCLTTNYRNTRAIAEFAAEFYTGLASGRPRLPPPSRNGERPSLHAHSNLYDTVSQIVSYERTFPDKSIGVMVPYSAQVKSFYNRLSGKTRVPVQGYLSSQPGLGMPQLDFSKPGVKLVTWASAKGLEFDTVFLPELQTFKGDPRSDDFRMKMYVLASRAKSQLFLQYSGEGVPAIVNELPSSLFEDRR